VQICFLISLGLALAPGYLHLNFFHSVVVFDLSVCESYQSNSPTDRSLPFIHPPSTKFKFPFPIKVPLPVLARPPRGRNHLNFNHTLSPVLLLQVPARSRFMPAVAYF